MKKENAELWTWDGPLVFSQIKERAPGLCISLTDESSAVDWTGSTILSETGPFNQRRLPRRDVAQRHPSQHPQQGME